MTTACGTQLSPRDQYESWHPRRCERPRLEGDTLCGVHRVAETRREAKENARREAAVVNQQREGAAAKRQKRLRELINYDGHAGGITPYYAHGGYTGGLVLSAAAVDRVIELLS